jgi:hypothetical protein
MSRTLPCWVVPLLLAVSGCGATIVPPPAPPRTAAAPVLIADYGYHSTLILPRAGGNGLVEYAYGDWTYFGHNKKSVLTALQALLASDQATLGRRMLDRLPNQPGLEQATGAISVIRFDAPADRVRQLERELEERFSTNLDSLIYSPAHGLFFVKDDQRYGVAHNCNHFTAEWLERLGCRIEGWAVTSKFRLKEPPSPSPVATTAAAAPPMTAPASPRSTATTRIISLSPS